MYVCVCVCSSRLFRKHWQYTLLLAYEFFPRIHLAIDLTSQPLFLEFLSIFVPCNFRFSENPYIDYEKSYRFLLSDAAHFDPFPRNFDSLSKHNYKSLSLLRIVYLHRPLTYWSVIQIHWLGDNGHKVEIMRGHSK